MNAHGQTICLSMIVKDEAPVIRRCLEALRPVIDRWVIVDTGSTDGTQEIVRRFMREVPGELFERPWRDFAHNRSEALALARDRGDYSLVMDADDTLELAPGFEMPRLAADSYTIEIADTGARYRRPQLVRNALPWRYQGVLHEFLTCEGARTQEALSGLRIHRGHDGARRKDAGTYRRDAEVLERALRTERDPFLRSRYTFYLAQSYRDCGETERALAAYLARGELGFWDEEVFVSLLSAARLMEGLGHPPDEVLHTYERASAACPWRAEALHGASASCFRHGRNQKGYEFAERGVGLALPADGLFVEDWIYEYGLLDQLAINGYWSGHYAESLDASLKLLSEGKLPAHEHGRVSANARFALEKMPRASRLGSAGSGGFLDQHALSPPRELRSRRREARVLVAILAKQMEVALPLYLRCLEALDYPKSSIVLSIRTNNNTDGTERVLREWVARRGHLYAHVELDASDVPEPVQRYGLHEWNATRFRVLGKIRGESLRRTLHHGCDFYFAADVDNFVRPNTLRELVALDLPVVAPLLRSVEPEDPYSNYHAEIDANGYYAECDQYHWVLNRWVRGVIEMPVVHCTYLVRADVVPRLAYQDGTDRHEYVVFCDSARRNGVVQYLDNRQVYGYLARDDIHAHTRRAHALLAHELEREERDGAARIESPASDGPDRGRHVRVV